MNKKGFTLVELLVVVAILGVLAAVGIVSFGGYLGKSKETATKMYYNAIKKRIIEVSTFCTMNDSIKLKKIWQPDNPQANSVIYNVNCYEDGNIVFFSMYINNDLINSGMGNKDAYNSGGIWQRAINENALNSFCDDDRNVGKVYTAQQNNSNSIPICVCFKLPCRNWDNKLSDTILIEQ